MKNEMQKLTRAEMKNIVGGGWGIGLYIWTCVKGAVYATQCSVLDPHLRCGFDACTETTTPCGYSGCS